MNAFRGILNDMPGNTAEMVMVEKFGKPVLMYDGIPFVTLDAVEADKVVGASKWAIATNAITYDTLDNAFRGFSQSDLGKTISEETSATSTVATWTDCDSISVASGTGFTDTETLTLDGDSVPLIYAVYMDEEEGVAAVYHRNLGDMAASMGDHYGPLGGFSANEIGLLQGPDIFRARLSWYGNIASQSPYAIARMRNFTNS
jgi:hypothetical protein